MAEQATTDNAWTVHAVEGPGEAARLAASRLEELIAEAIALRDVAHVALSGGETPRPAYELLAERLGEPGKVHFWFGDERAVGPDDDESNYKMAKEALAEAELATDALHRIEGELGPEEAAARYASELTARLEAGAEDLPVLDVALQGMGPDGHTASLFPGNPAVEAGGICVAVHDAPKPPPDRISLTVPALRAARAVVFLVVGEAKAEAVARTLGGRDPDVPASLLGGPNAELIADGAALSRRSGEHEG